MRAQCAGIAAIWIVSLLAGRGLRLSADTSPIPATSAEITAQPTARSGEASGAPPVEGGDSEAPRVDLIGNEVEDALADYRIDQGGSVYERHSPDTAVQRLGSPST